MEVMHMIVAGVLFVVIGFLWAFQPWKDDKIDLTSKEESKLSEEGVHVPEHIEAIKEAVAKAPRVRRKIKKIVVEPTCELENVDIAAPVEKKKRTVKK